MARRNVRKLALRPPLPRRAVVWFPPFPADAGIEPFRHRFDPLADALPGHLNLVFPFATTLSSVQLAAYVKRIVGNWPPLPIVFRDVEGLLDTFALLMVREGADAASTLHDKLYANGGVLAPHLRKDMRYSPHVTLGRVDCAREFPPMMTAAHAICGSGREWRMILRELAVISHDATGKISIDSLVSLNTR